MTRDPSRQPVLIIAGPSGSGKSALAIDIATAADGVVINADSMQLYRDLRVLTARPSPDDEARVPHRLYGILAADDPGSVGRWLQLALAEITDGRSKGRLPIVVGGTGLYLKALMQGLSSMPPIPAEIRRKARSLFPEVGEAEFRRHLASLDADAAARRLDGQRLVRAYEVAAATGRTLAQWQQCAPPSCPVAGPLVAVTLLPPRPALNAALDQRFETMIAAGALDEVRALCTRDLDPGLPVMKALGVADLAAALNGAMTLEAASAAAKQATRRYAKRQVTWLRHQLTAATVIDEQYSERNSEAICTFIRRRLLTVAA